jgi:hypothetical protein
MTTLRLHNARFRCIGEPKSSSGVLEIRIAIGLLHSWPPKAPAPVQAAPIVSRPQQFTKTNVDGR